jgi:hypothetical protein
MGADRHVNGTRRPPFWTGRRIVTCLAASVLLLGLGFAVREAEFNQVGSSNTASMWIFVASGVCAYAAVAGLFFRPRKGRP